MNLFRTNKIYNEYQLFKKKLSPDHCALCDKNKLNNTRQIIKKYKYWTVAKNDFPYDKVTNTHNLLILNRHTGNEENLTVSEVSELFKIKKIYLQNDEYELLENNIKRKSIKDHFHLHLLVWKK